MDLPILTEPEVAILTRSVFGVLLTSDALATRTALYERHLQSRLWHCLERGLQLTHITTEDGRGFRWQHDQHCFVPCRCPQCLSTDTDDEP